MKRLRVVDSDVSRRRFCVRSSLGGRFGLVLGGERRPVAVVILDVVQTHLADQFLQLLKPNAEISRYRFER